MRRITIGAAVIALLTFAGPTGAQERFSIDVRGGAAFATEDYGAVDLGTGIGFAAAVRYRFMPHLGAYLGWNWYHFSPEAEGGVVEDLDLEDTGYSLGLMFEHPLTESLAGWVMGGAAFDHTEVEIDGESVGDSDHGFGWEAGAGVSFAVSDRISLLPGVRYRSFTPDLGESEDDPSVSYLAAEIGLSWKL